MSYVARLQREKTEAIRAVMEDIGLPLGWEGVEVVE